MSSSTPDPFDRDEEAVAAELGIDREKIHALRANGSLLEGEDWKKRGARVRLSAVGLHKAMTLLMVPRPVEVYVEAATGQPGGKDGKKTARGLLGDGTFAVTFVRGAKSPHMAIGEYGGAQVTVRLKTWKNFRRGMVMTCRRLGPHFFELARRCPRYPGRW